MSNSPIPEERADSRCPWWREPEVAVLIGLVVAAYFLRLGDVSMRGEEPTRSEVGFEMLRSGDWVVPRVQGQVLNRPPLQNWLIAVSSVVCGSREAWAVRLPSALAMLLTTLLLYGYARTCLSRAGALAAAAVFPTFGEMFTTGCQAETEMVFIALVAAGLLLWHWGRMRGWPALRTWVVGYVFVGLAVLCKGPQPPVYFLGSVGAYLVLTGRWRDLFTRAHLAGALVGLGVVLTWLLPFAQRCGWPETYRMIMSDTSSRFLQWDPGEVALHLVQFPAEVLGCTLPWSLLLLGYVRRSLRRSPGAARPLVLFNAPALAIAFVSIWVPPNGQTRYLAPLYPCLAVLCGVVVQCCLRADVPDVIRNTWRGLAQLQAGFIAVVGLAAVGAALFLADHPQYGPWAEPRPGVALGYAAACLLLAVLTWRGRHGGDAARGRTALLAGVCFMVLTFTGMLTNVRIRRTEDPATAVARLKEMLPKGQRVVSFGHVDLLFAFYYGERIERLPLPAHEDDPGTEPDVCFCFNVNEGRRPTLPFAWEEVAAISMVRNRTPTPERMVVVGRRLPSGTVATRPSIVASGGR